ncbi:hypothetical protein ACIGZJ_31305 [Kitasatospora sp. NPDC052868]|uniref:hypothetical protein n=1 Tax=Kitasatospora sp. NPDC052868 TaxID=3364060 RepID=UPI0037CABB73
MSDDRRESGQLVASLGSSLRSGAASLGTVPKLLEELLVSGGWQDFTTQLGDHVTYTEDEFEEFIRALPLKGLGADLDLVERLIHERIDLLTRFYELTPRKRGNPQFVAITRDTRDCDEPDGSLAEGRRKAGNNVEAIVRRLERERPDLHAMVKAGEIRPYSAAVQAGWRKAQTTIPLQDPQGIARKLLEKLGREQAAEVEYALACLLRVAPSQAGDGDG